MTRNDDGLASQLGQVSFAWSIRMSAGKDRAVDCLVTWFIDTRSGDRGRFHESSPVGAGGTCLRWADPSILLRTYAHSRMDKRMEAQAKMIEAMGLNEQTVRHLM